MARKLGNPRTGRKLQPVKKNWLANPEHTQIYNKQKWRRFSFSYKMRHPVCEMPGCTRPSAFTDHKEPLSEGGAIYDENNIQALCVTCNASKTGKQKTKF